MAESAEYLFVFGRPDESNALDGAERIEVVLISASSRADARTWGEAVASDYFVRVLRLGAADAAGYAQWIAVGVEKDDLLAHGTPPRRLEMGELPPAW